jgi:hypothetical protein
MRNVTGAPVERDDFFDRPRELERLLRELADGANVRINAPRRVGKTSLVLRLCDVWSTGGNPAVFLNVEDATDEFSFLEKLLEALRGASLEPDAVTQCRMWISKARKTMGLSKVGFGLEVELAGDDAATQPSSVGAAVASVLGRIESGKRTVLIAIDEMPEVLLALSRSENGTRRVEALLHWLRAVRQTYRQHIRWVFLGSIGLEGFVEERLLGKTINDLTAFTLEALTPGEARAFLSRLADDNGLPIHPDLQDRILTRVGWALPHHLQVVFHALRELGEPALDEGSLDRAMQNLLGPANLSQFDTWRQRLDEQFGPEDARAAKAILGHLCREAGGRSRDDCLTVLMGRQPGANPDEIGERVSRLLQLLQRDGYLMGSGGLYAFRSFLLRDYWYRRHVA